ncbi:LAME_0D03554g1_1 [Lachancea meyersii CBS 8951]|uniref:LAME_0D03554g1_1 n=1 Tax=Lachancea meyersii CBS 8951 TaxID=1266667 RepID=A0A1G4J7N1_9SACH|nr:LAME_0D03554g1_1 [Lachancea meyersii CBS 8951]
MAQELPLVDPAKIRTLLVPIGQWTRSNFTEKVEALQERFEARLVDITPIEDSHFNPQGFPQGRLFFDFHTSLFEAEQSLFLHDFELYRKTFVVIGLVNAEAQKPEIVLDRLQKRYPDPISHNLLYFDGKQLSQDRNIYCASTTNLETIVCDIGRDFLEALGRYYTSYKHVTLRSPGAIGGTSITKTSLMRQPSVAISTSASARVTSNPIESTVSNSIKRSASLKSLALNSSASSDQHRAKARQTKILGNFKLLAGQYLDSLNSFAEAATTLHKYHDYIWLGSALEGLALSVVLLTYLRVSFQIPSIISAICSVKDFENSSASAVPQRNSVSSATIQSPRNSLSSKSSRFNVIESHTVAIPLLIKCISDKVLHYYEMSTSHNTEYAPQIVYCEHILRIARFMAYCHSHNELERDLFKPSYFCEPSKASGLSLNGTCSFKEYFSKMDVCLTANRLFELQLKEMNIFSQIKVYTSLAVLYRNLGFKRKYAFILRILLVSLLPRNVSDSVVSVLDSDHHDILLTLIQAYRIDRQPETLINDAASCTWVTIQKNILMLAINMSAKTQNKQKVREFSLMLLQKYSHALTRSEQLNLFRNNILPNINDQRNFSYWDPFLLRRLNIIQLENHREVPRKRHIASQKPKNSTQRHSQVFNPFKDLGVRDLTDKSKNQDMVAEFLLGESAELVVVLQNPFKFDLEITQLSFNKCDEDFVKFLGDSVRRELPFIVKPNSMASVHFPVIFTKKTDAAHEITELQVGVFGLPPTLFPIVTAEKSKNDSASSGKRAKSGLFKFHVINEQPQIEFVSSTLDENCIMMLDGTKQTFDIVLRNQSLGKPANYLEFTHVTNVESDMSADYWKKLAPDDLFDVEKQLEWTQKKCIKIRNLPKEIPANSSVTLTVDIDASQAPFQFTKFEINLMYGCKTEESSSSVYAKSLSMPFNISLRRSLEVPSLEVMPASKELLETEGSFLQHSHSSIQTLDTNSSALLLIDIRNSWDENATVSVHFRDFHSNAETLCSHSTKRFVIPITNIHPSVNWGAKEIPKLVGGRQFVSSGLTRDQLIAMRRSFWCREMLIESLKCDWKFHNTTKTRGTVHFRQFLDKIDPRTVDILCQHRDVPYHVTLSSSKAKVLLGESVRLEAKVSTSETHITDEHGLVRLEFIIYNRRTGLALPSSNTRLLYNGQLSCLTSPNKDNPAVLSITPIDPGDYEVGCCINSLYFNDQPQYFRVERPISSILEEVQ